MPAFTDLDSNPLIKEIESSPLSDSCFPMPGRHRPIHLQLITAFEDDEPSKHRPQPCSSSRVTQNDTLQPITSVGADHVEQPAPESSDRLPTANEPIADDPGDFQTVQGVYVAH